MARLRTSLSALQRAQQKKGCNRSMMPRRAVLAGLMLSAAGGMLGYIFLSGRREHSSFTLQDAREHPAERQRFLDKLVKKGEILGCSDIVYDPSGEKIIDYLNAESVRAEKRFRKAGERMYLGGTLEVFRQGYDVKTPDVLELSGEGQRVPIFVGRKIFEGNEFSYLTEQDLRAILIVHEGEHVRQHREGFSYLNKQQVLQGLETGALEQRVVYDAFEFDAYLHEVPRLLSGPWNVSWYHLNESKARFLATSLSLTKAAARGGLQQQLVEKLQNYAAQQPLLRDVSVDPRWFEEYRKVMAQ